MIDLSTYTFCEPSFAGPRAPWCIRKLTAIGKKLGGGVDTPSLCGRVKPTAVGGPGGWDLTHTLGEADLEAEFTCKKCVAKLREQVA
jgi:hypothetical protein